MIKLKRYQTSIIVPNDYDDARKRDCAVNQIADFLISKGVIHLQVVEHDIGGFQKIIATIYAAKGGQNE